MTVVAWTGLGLIVAAELVIRWADRRRLDLMRRQIDALKFRHRAERRRLLAAMPQDARRAFVLAEAERRRLERMWRLPAHQTAGRRTNGPGPASPPERS